MSSQVAMLKSKRQAVLETNPQIVTISTSVAGGVPSFNVTSGTGVTANGESLEVTPGNYFIQFDLTDGTFDNPAITLATPVGVVSVPPSAPTTATVQNRNGLISGDSREVYRFRFHLADGSSVDPTLINTPDPG